LHVIDISSTGRDPVEDFQVITRELELYSTELMAKPQMVAASKMDAMDDPGRVEKLRGFCKERALELFEISAVTGYGLDRLVNALGTSVEKCVGQRGTCNEFVRGGRLGLVNGASGIPQPRHQRLEPQSIDMSERRIGA
jgi:GTP-binding protein